MDEAARSSLAAWKSFHVIVGSSAGAGPARVTALLQGPIPGLEVPVRSTLLLAATALLAGSVACEAPHLTAPDVPPAALGRAAADSAGVLIMLNGKVRPAGASLDQLRMSDVESVEIIKGSAAATRYGETCHLVIVVRAKPAGNSDRARFH